MEAVMVTQSEAAQRLRDAAMSIVDLSQWAPGIVFDLKHELFLKDGEAIHPRLPNKYEVGNLTAGKYFDSIKKALGVDDSTMMAIQDAVMVGRKVYREVAPKHDDTRGCIIVNDDMGIQVDGIVDAAIKINNPPIFFIKGGEFCSLYGDRILPVQSEEYMAQMSNYLGFYKEENGKLKKVIEPSRTVAKAAYQRVSKLAPTINGIAFTPIVHRGEIYAGLGYQKNTCTYIKGEYIPVPEHATIDEAKASLKWLMDEVFVDFPFREDGSARTNAVGALLMAILKQGHPYMITPYISIDKQQPRTGADTLSNIYKALIGYEQLGNEGCAMPSNDDEISKVLLGLLRSGALIAVFGNIKSQIGGAVLEDAATKGTFAGRVLHTSDIDSHPMSMVLIFNGNNLTFTKDMARRTLRVALFYDKPNPEMRKFKHPNVDTWVVEHRTEVLVHAYTIIRAWLDAGSPMAPVNSNFENFIEILDQVNGMLHMVGMTGLMANRVDTEKETDQFSQDAELLEALYEIQPELIAMSPQHSVSGFTARSVWMYYNQVDSNTVCIPEKLTTKGRLKTENHIGKMLNKITGQWHDGYQVAMCSHEWKTWMVRRAD